MNGLGISNPRMWSRQFYSTTHGGWQIDVRISRDYVVESYAKVVIDI